MTELTTLPIALPKAIQPDFSARKNRFIKKHYSKIPKDVDLTKNKINVKSGVMNTRLKKGLAFGAAVGAILIGAEMCGDKGDKPTRPPATDTDTPDDKPTNISYTVRDDIDAAISSPSRPRFHFVPPLPPREPFVLDDTKSPPANLAGHSAITGGLGQAERDTILRSIFAKAECAKKGSETYETCKENQRENIAGEQNSDTRRKMIDGYIDSMRKDPACETARRAAEDECLKEARKQDPEAQAAEEHYFLAQGAARLAGLEEAVRNGTPIHPMELTDALYNVKSHVLNPETSGLGWFNIEEVRNPSSALRKILDAAGMSKGEFIKMLQTIRMDYIPAEEAAQDDDEAPWDPEKAPPPPNPARMRSTIDSLLEIAREQ